MSNCYEEIKADWADFSSAQKVAALTVNSLTLARPIIMGAVVAGAQDAEHEWTIGGSVAIGAAYATDLDGHLARATQTETKLGEVADRSADRIATNLLELTLVRRGEESAVRFGLRLARTVGIVSLRHYVRLRCDEPDYSSCRFTKASSAFRQGVNVFAASPLGKRYPKTRTTLQTITTTAELVSGVVNARKLIKGNNGKVKSN